MNQKNRVQEFDILRGIGAMAVIAIHVTSVYYRFDTHANRYMLLGTINRLCAFAVPFFLFLSAMQLTYIELPKDVLHAGRFYRKRFLKIVPVYLAWVLVCFLYLKINHYWTIDPFQNPVSFFVEYVLQGKVFYHLYFIPLILQLYLLLPAIFWLVKRIRVNTGTVGGFAVTCVVLCCIQWCLECVYKKYISSSFSNHAVLVTSYMLVIGIGVWCGANFECLRVCAGKWYWVSPIWGVIGFLYVQKVLYPERTLCTMIPSWAYFLLYALVSSLLLTLLAIRISDVWEWLRRLLSEIGRCSFGIYLLHPLILDLVQKVIYDERILYAKPVVSLLLVAVRFVITFFCSWGIVVLFLKGRKYLRIRLR